MPAQISPEMAQTIGEIIQVAGGLANVAAPGSGAAISLGVQGASVLIPLVIRAFNQINAGAQSAGVTVEEWLATLQAPAIAEAPADIIKSAESAAGV